MNVLEGMLLNPTQMVSLLEEETESCLGLKVRQPRQKLGIRSDGLRTVGALWKLGRGRKDLPAPSPLARPSAAASLRSRLSSAAEAMAAAWLSSRAQAPGRQTEALGISPAAPSRMPQCPKDTLFLKKSLRRLRRGLIS